MNFSANSPAGLPVILFEQANQWADWLDEHHANAAGLWLRLAKKESGLQSIDYAEALTVALCYGWIDGQKKRFDEDSWLQKFTPRSAKSIWSKVNREKALHLIETGQMKPAGLRAVQAAQQDGRWAAAYEAQSKATVPDDLQAELDTYPDAQAFFATLDSRNRYAILFRIQTAKKPETRLKRIQQFVEMLRSGEKLYP
ncbi:MAG TPA: YdeI/OmpD-associated family protein [Caldilineaceae bacterium]|nr:YdeI/OmpD-associated family protein [Caldilineaceae bacterium]